MQHEIESLESTDQAVAARVERDAVRLTDELAAEGRWSAADDLALDRAFEVAAEAALSVPSLAERSPRLRRVAARFVPRSLRPGLGRLARRVDAVIRRVRS